MNIIYWQLLPALTFNSNDVSMKGLFSILLLFIFNSISAQTDIWNRQLDKPDPWDSELKQENPWIAYLPDQIEAEVSVQEETPVQKEDTAEAVVVVAGVPEVEAPQSAVVPESGRSETANMIQAGKLIVSTDTFELQPFIYGSAYGGSRSITVPVVNESTSVQTIKEAGAAYFQSSGNGFNGFIWTSLFNVFGLPSAIVITAIPSSRVTIYTNAFRTVNPQLDEAQVKAFRSGMQKNKWKAMWVGAGIGILTNTVFLLSL